MDESTDSVTSEQQYQALANQAEDRTRGLRDLDDRSFATGVAVHIGGRFFLATAGHVLCDRHRMAFVAPNGELPVSEVRRDWKYNHLVDVGFLEVRTDQVFAGASFVDSDGILAKFDTNMQHNVLVAGFPIDAHLMSPRGTECVPFFCPSVTVPCAQWPRTWPSEYATAIRLSRRRDVVIRYPEPQEQAAIRNRNTGAVAATTVRPGPQGLSGCGIWLACASRGAKTGLWLPHMQLIGLQHAQLGTSRLLRGTQISAWLDLLAAHYTDMRPEIVRIKRSANSFWRVTKVLPR